MAVGADPVKSPIPVPHLHRRLGQEELQRLPVDDAYTNLPHDHPYASDDLVLWERKLIDITDEIEEAADEKY